MEIIYAWNRSAAKRGFCQRPTYIVIALEVLQSRMPSQDSENSRLESLPERVTLVIRDVCKRRAVSRV